MDLGYRSQSSIEGEVKIDFSTSVAAVESELSFFGAQDVPVRAAIGIPDRVLADDPLDDEVIERSWILPGRIVKNSDGALEGCQTSERDRLEEACRNPALAERPHQHVQG